MKRLFGIGIVGAAGIFFVLYLGLILFFHIRSASAALIALLAILVLFAWNDIICFLKGKHTFDEESSDVQKLSDQCGRCGRTRFDMFDPFDDSGRK